MIETKPYYLKPDWPAPDCIQAAVSTRIGGSSEGAYSSFNLSAYVGDDPAHVAANRQLLYQSLKLPEFPLWLTQVHRTDVLHRNGQQPITDNNQSHEYDACYSSRPNTVCAVHTADCLPVLFCSQDGQEIAAAHAGWRGLANGVLTNTVARFISARAEILVWLGPAIGPASFKVDDDVRSQFLAQWTPYGIDEVAGCFASKGSGQYLCDLYSLASLQLRFLGVSKIYGGCFDTFADSQRFYSFRRDGRQTGRMASLIWRTDADR